LICLKNVGSGLDRSEKEIGTVKTVPYEKQSESKILIILINSKK